MIKEIDEKELDSLISRLQEAIDKELSLNKEDMELLLQVLMSFASLSEHLADNDVTLHKLKKIAGLVSSSEKLKDGTKSKSKLRTAEPKPEKVLKPIVCHHKLEGLSKGDVCPKCGMGKLYKYEPAITIRISGNSPLSCTQHIREKLRCNACLEYFTADLSDEVKEDGGENNQYTYSAKAIMAIYRYFGGMPLHRQESLNHLFGVPVSASTILDQVESVANAGNVIFNYLKKLASNAFSYEMDDTTNRILNAGKEMIPDRRTGKLKERSGIYTSGIIAKIDDYKIVLFKTNIGHAGEFIDEILKTRDIHAPPPLIMSDALPSNRPTVIKDYHLTLCNAHARREFFDLENYFPDKVTWLIEKYGKIWDNENQCKENKPGERLAYHHEHSLPVMNEIKEWATNMLETKQVEENSSLGKAIKYLLNNFNGLSAFCYVEKAKLDNNEMESTLKLIIRGRKNSLFFKTQAGADIADVLTSLIATCEKHSVNSFDYLIQLQKYSDKVRINPQIWLPWNYQDNLKNIENQKTLASVS